MGAKLLTEHNLEFLCLKGGCTGSSESTLVKMPHCWKSHVTAQITATYIHSKGQRDVIQPLNQIWASARDFQQLGMCDQQSLRSACAYAQSDQSLCVSLEYSVIVKLLTEHHLEFLSLKGGCRGSSESTLVKMPHCWKSHALAHMFLIVYPLEAKHANNAPKNWKWRACKIFWARLSSTLSFFMESVIVSTMLAFGV